MKNIPERVEKEIIQLAKQYDIQKVILFVFQKISNS